MITILIATLPNRDRTLCIESIQSVLGYETKILIDDRVDISIGHKRAEMISKVTTKYLAFIDDDDIILDGYSKIFELMDKDVDQIKIMMSYYVNGIFKYNAIRSNHIAINKTELAQIISFYDTGECEDTMFATELSYLIDTFDVINEPCYEYKFIERQKEYDRKSNVISKCIDSNKNIRKELLCGRGLFDFEKVHYFND